MNEICAYVCVYERERERERSENRVELQHTTNFILLSFLLTG